MCPIYRIFLLYNAYILISLFVQAVYNANKFAKLVRKRERLQNWLDYNQLKFERHPDKKPTSKVLWSYFIYIN